MIHAWRIRRGLQRLALGHFTKGGEDGFTVGVRAGQIPKIDCVGSWGGDCREGLAGAKALGQGSVLLAQVYQGVEA